VGPHSRRAGRALLPLAAAALLLGVSLVWRLVYRGYRYVSWETMGQAFGQYVLSTGTLAEAVRQVFWNTRHFLYFTGEQSLLYSLVPGGLGVLWPWEFWTHVVSLVLWGLSLVLLGRAVGLDARTWPFLLLGLAASPVTLSFAVNGGPYIAGVLPHAMALAITQSRACRERPGLSLALGLLTTEVSWHCHNMGKLHFVVFLAGAVLIAGVRPATRAAWATAALVELAQLWRFETQAAGGFLVHDIARVLGDPWTPLRRLVDAMYLSATLDVPVLAWVGVAALFVVRRDAWFYRAIYLGQLAPLVVMAFGSTELFPPRRVLVAQFYDLALLGAALPRLVRPGREWRLARWGLAAALLAGAAVQLDGLRRFTSTPLSNQVRTLPYTEWVADFYIRQDLVRIAHWIVEQVEAGRRIVLLYSFETYAENTTDPAALPDRVYLHLGHRRFVDSVLAFSDWRCRYACVPFIPVGEVRTRLADLGPLDRVLVMKYEPETRAPFVRELQAVWGALTDLYDVVPELGPDGKPLALSPFALYGLRPKATTAGR
jgi:hypothetical protein